VLAREACSDPDEAFLALAHALNILAEQVPRKRVSSSVRRRRSDSGMVKATVAIDRIYAAEYRLLNWVTERHPCGRASGRKGERGGPSANLAVQPLCDVFADLDRLIQLLQYVLRQVGFLRLAPHTVTTGRASFQYLAHAFPHPLRVLTCLCICHRYDSFRG
jgi:hypothetical protein